MINDYILVNDYIKAQFLVLTVKVFDWCKENHKAVCEGYLHWSTAEKDTDELLKLYIEKENAPGSLNDTGLNEHLFPEYEINIEPEVIVPTKKAAKKTRDEFDEESNFV